MTRKEINAKIEEIEEEIFLEEMVDRGYNFVKVYKLKDELKALKKMLAEM